LSGLAGEPRHYERLAGPVASFASIASNERGITFSALLLGGAQLLFLFNLIYSAKRGPQADENPWQATTLEWAPNSRNLHVNHGPYDYEVQSGTRKFFPQWEPASKQE